MAEAALGGAEPTTKQFLPLPSDEEIQAIFDLYDKGKSGTLPMASLVEVVRAMGQDVRAEEREMLEEVADQEKAEVFTPEGLKKALELRGRNSDDRDRVAEAFFFLMADTNGLDREKPRISCAEFRHICTSFGESPISSEAVDDLLRTFPIADDGTIDLRLCVKQMLTQDELL